MKSWRNSAASISPSCLAFSAVYEAAVDPLADLVRPARGARRRSGPRWSRSMLSKSQFCMASASGLGPLRMKISAALLYAPQVRKSGLTPILSNRPAQVGRSRRAGP